MVRCYRIYIVYSGGYRGGGGGGGGGVEMIFTIDFHHIW